MTDVQPTKWGIFTATNPTMTIIIPELAAEIGLNESIVLLQLAFWIKQSDNVREGVYWTFQSLRGMREKAFPYWTVDTIRRTLQNLITGKYILLGNYNPKKYDKTRWYALNPDKLSSLKSILVAPLEGGVYENRTGVYENRTTIPEITTENKDKELKDSPHLEKTDAEMPPTIISEQATSVPEVSSVNGTGTSTPTPPVAPPPPPPAEVEPQQIQAVIHAWLSNLPAKPSDGKNPYAIPAYRKKAIIWVEQGYSAEDLGRYVTHVTSKGRFWHDKHLPFARALSDAPAWLAANAPQSGENGNKPHGYSAEGEKKSLEEAAYYKQRAAHFGISVQTYLMTRSKLEGWDDREQQAPRT